MEQLYSSLILAFLFITNYSRFNYADNTTRLFLFFSFLLFIFPSFVYSRLSRANIFTSSTKSDQDIRIIPRPEVFSLINGYEIPNCGHILSGMELSTKDAITVATQLESRLVSHTRPSRSFSLAPFPSTLRLSYPAMPRAV